MDALRISTMLKLPSLCVDGVVVRTVVVISADVSCGLLADADPAAEGG